MRRARLGQIGVGGYGGAILKGIAAAGNAELVAVGDRDAVLCESVAAATGAAVREPEAILTAGDLDAVVLVLPNHLHRGFCERAAAAGKHVYVEKPIANRCADARAMIEACAAAGVQLMVGHNIRRAGAFRAVAEWVAAGRIGALLDVQAEFTHPGGLRLDPSTWRFDPELCPTLPLIQLGVHLIDVANVLLGTPVEVTSLQRHRLIPGDNVDVTQTLCAYESGALLSLASHYCAPYRYTCHVTGSDGHIDATPSTAELRVGAEHEVWSGDEVDTQAAEMREFAAAVLGEGGIETGGESGLRALAVVEAAWVSARERRTVRVEELAGWR